MRVTKNGAYGACVAAGVLVLVVMSASAWASNGNAANAKLCAPSGYPGVLLTQEVGTFASTGKCASYTAKGGQLIGFDAVAEPAVAGEFNATCSGFGAAGLKSVNCVVLYGSGLKLAGIGFGPVGGVAAPDGTFSASGKVPCVIQQTGLGVTALAIAGLTADNTYYEILFPPPSGC